MTCIATQGSITTTQQLASTQNAYGHFQLPILRRNFNPPTNEALDVPLPASHPAFAPTPAPAPTTASTPGAPLNVVIPAPVDGWTNSMMAGWWTQNTGALNMDNLHDPDGFGHCNPADLDRRPESFERIVANGVTESS